MKKPASVITVASPFPPESFYDLYDWIQPVWDAVSDDNSPTDREEFIDMQVAMAETETVKTWGVWKDHHELGGFVSATVQPHRPWLAVCHCTFKKSFWGTATTLPALHAVATELFEVDIHKIEMWVFETNRAIRSLVKRLGGVEEGVLSAQTLKHGNPTSMAVYGLFQNGLVKMQEREHSAVTDQEEVLCQRL